MSSLIGSVIGGIGGFFLGGPAGAVTGAQIGGGIGANIERREVAGDQMAFQRFMSDTAHRREVADLRGAGLNPILSGTGGYGATTPPGSMAMLSNPFEGASSAYGQMAQAFRTEAETMPHQELRNKLDAEINQMASNIALNNAQQQRVLEEARIAAVEAGIAERVAHIRTKAELASWFQAFNEATNAGEISSGKAGEILKWLERIMPLFRGTDVLRAPIRRYP